MIIDIKKIRTLLQSPNDFVSYLQTLSNSQFRKVSQLLGDNLLSELSVDDFWALFSTLFFQDRKAYLGTLLKALTVRIQQSRIDDIASTSHNVNLSNQIANQGLWSETFVEVCRNLNDTDRKKVLLSLLPLMDVPTDAERLLRQCMLTEAATWIPYLLLTPTKPCYFLLLKALKYVEHDRPLLIRTCHYLMKRGDEQSFNIASIIRLSFSLEEVRGSFSLQLQPYQLSRIEQNYSDFLRTINF